MGDTSVKAIEWERVKQVVATPLDSFKQSQTWLHTHTHIHTHTRTHVHTHARTHAHARTRTHARLHARTHAHTHTKVGLNFSPALLHWQDFRKWMYTLGSFCLRQYLKTTVIKISLSALKRSALQLSRLKTQDWKRVFRFAVLLSLFSFHSWILTQGYPSRVPNLFRLRRL